MSRVAVQLIVVGAKHAVDMIGEATYHLQQAAFTGRTEECHPSLNQVTGTVQFMAFGEIGPAFPGRFHRKIGVQITIFTLRGGNQLNHLVGGFFQFRIWLLAQ